MSNKNLACLLGLRKFSDSQQKKKVLFHAEFAYFYILRSLCFPEISFMKMSNISRLKNQAIISCRQNLRNME